MSLQGAVEQVLDPSTHHNGHERKARTVKQEIQAQTFTLKGNLPVLRRVTLELLARAQEMTPAQKQTLKDLIANYADTARHLQDLYLLVSTGLDERTAPLAPPTEEEKGVTPTAPQRTCFDPNEI